jgi:hypothetical protein
MLLDQWFVELKQYGHCAHVISLFAKINLTSDHKIKECPWISLRIGLILYPETATEQ